MSEPSHAIWWDDHYTGISVACWEYRCGDVHLFGAEKNERRARRAMRRAVRVDRRLRRRLVRLAHG